MTTWLRIPRRGGAVVLHVTAREGEEPTAADYRRFARWLIGMADARAWLDTAETDRLRALVAATPAPADGATEDGGG